MDRGKDERRELQIININLFSNLEVLRNQVVKVKPKGTVTNVTLGIGAVKQNHLSLVNDSY